MKNHTSLMQKWYEKSYQCFNLINKKQKAMINSLLFSCNRLELTRTLPCNSSYPTPPQTCLQIQTYTYPLAWAKKEYPATLSGSVGCFCFCGLHAWLMWGFACRFCVCVRGFCGCVALSLLFWGLLGSFVALVVNYAGLSPSCLYGLFLCVFVFGCRDKKKDNKKTGFNCCPFYLFNFPIVVIK